LHDSKLFNHCRLVLRAAGKEIVAQYMQRDFDYEDDENFQIALSPFSDRRITVIYL
jgi:hypothetical protein